MKASSPLYFVYGLWLESNRPVPGLAPLPAAPTVDLRVWFDLAPPSWIDGSEAGREAWYVSPYSDEEGRPWLTVWKLQGGSGYRLFYSDGAEFVVDRAGARVWATWPETLTLEDVATYFLGPILGFALRLRGVICLHASAIVAGDRAIAILGPSGSGKSTTAAGFARHGHPVLADDMAALWERGDRFLIQPAHPRLRLLPDAVEALYGSACTLPHLTASWDKFYLDLEQNGHRFRKQPLPLAAIYLLDERSDDPAAPFIEAMPARARLMALVENAYVSTLLDRTMRAREFDVLGRLASHVPVRRVTPHTDTSRLSQLSERILDDLHLSILGIPGPGQAMRGLHVQHS